MRTSFFRTFWVGFALCGPFFAAQAACPNWSTAERFTFNGAEVADTHTGLVWARCSVGQSWSGSACVGTATGFTHEAALVHAQSTSGWRLPNVKELASLADKGCGAPAIDSVAFPGTSSSWYWTSSPYAGNGNYAWGIDFYYGYVSQNGRGVSNAVRLVRAGSTCSSTATSTSSTDISTTGGELGTPITSAGSTGGVASGSGDSGTTSTGTGFTPSCF